MRLVEGLDAEVLLKYTFERVDKQEERSCADSTLASYEYKYDIGHSRRGQFYYILVDSIGMLHIYASKPDGSSGTIPFPNIVSRLINDGIIK